MLRLLADYRYIATAQSLFCECIACCVDKLWGATRGSVILLYCTCPRGLRVAGPMFLASEANYPHPMSESQLNSPATSQAPIATGKCSYSQRHVLSDLTNNSPFNVYYRFAN